MAPASREFKFPTVAEFSLFMGYGALLTLLFGIVYGQTNDLASKAQTVSRIYFDWELGIPFVAPMIIVYLSLNLLTATTLFFLQKKEIHYLALTYSVAILLGGSVFYFFPTAAGFERAGLSSDWSNFYSVLYSLDRPHNLFPSLHIALSSISVFCISKDVSNRVRIILYCWLVLICFSVVLTHQHHLVDVIGGLLLGSMCANTFFRPFVEQRA